MLTTLTKSMWITGFNVTLCDKGIRRYLINLALTVDENKQYNINISNVICLRGM